MLRLNRIRFVFCRMVMVVAFFIHRIAIAAPGEGTFCATYSGKCFAEYKQCLSVLTRQSNDLPDNVFIFKNLPEKSMNGITTSDEVSTPLSGRAALEKFSSSWQVSLSNGELYLIPKSPKLTGKIEISRDKAKKMCSSKFEKCANCK